MNAHSNHASHTKDRLRMSRSSTAGQGAHPSPYGKLGVMLVLSFLAMYVLMYVMVNTWNHVYMNWNQVYMAALMTAAMLTIEVGVMFTMYPNRRFNAGLMLAGLIGLVVAWGAIREQWGIDDRQFLRSMVPHHAAALLMCEQADLSLSENQSLCRQILASQQREIDEMEARLAEATR